MSYAILTDQVDPTLVAPIMGGSTGIVVVPHATSGLAMVIPGGAWLLHADFSRNGNDLVLTGSDGKQILIQGYFATQAPPNLMTDGGAMLKADLVAKLAGPLAPGQYAQAGTVDTSPSEPIGRIDTADGTVEAIRVDGTRVTLAKGDAVFQGDTLVTGANGAVGVIFADDTTFSLAASGRMVLDEMVYDPGAQSGSFKMSVVQGVFSFVSGQIAKTSPDGMSLVTPVANIGIRGTTVAGNAAAEGQGNNITLLPDPNGQIGEISVTTGAGTVVLNTAGATTTTIAFNAPPSPIRIMSQAEINSAYGSAVNTLPNRPAAVQGNQTTQQQGAQNAQNSQNTQGPQDVQGPQDPQRAQDAPIPQDSQLIDSPPPPVDAFNDMLRDLNMLAAAFLETRPTGFDFLRIDSSPPDFARLVDFSQLPSLPEDTEPRLDSNSTSDINTVIGTTGADTLAGTTGTDILIGNGGNDTFMASLGNDIVFAGTGDDTLRLDDPLEIKGAIYDDVTGDLTFTIGPDSGGNNAQRFTTIIRDHAANPLDRVSSDNELNVTEIVRIGTYDSPNHKIDASVETVDFALIGTDAFGDILIGGSGDDIFVGNGGDDTMTGGGGKDEFHGGNGNNTIDGGIGADEVNYDDYNGSFAVDVDLAAGTATNAFGGTDTLTSIEDVHGSNFDDTIDGSSAINNLNGGGGNDDLFGGAGADTLSGGSGGDTFIYQSASDSTVSAFDIIKDFNASDGADHDQIDFSALGTYSSLDFLGSGAFTGTGSSLLELRFNTGTNRLEVDTNGDAASDMEIELTNVAAASLDDTDFIAVP